MNFSRVVVAATLVAAILAPASCNSFDERGFKFNLKPGINYMQPLKWRLTYHYRVQEVIPKQRILRQGSSASDSGIPVVGKGTWEVWLTEPWANETMLSLKRVSASPSPTKIVKGKNTDAVFLYYDFAPHGNLPQEMYADVTYEFTTCEQYLYAEAPAHKAYDKNSSVYKQYTKMERPFTYNSGMSSALASFKPGDNDHIACARAAYDYMLDHFSYDEGQTEAVIYGGLEGMSDASRAWENCTGQCDELTNVYVTLLRKSGIPARPVLGFAHYPVPIPGGFGLGAGGHAWAEFWLPDVGWVPVDPTWGATPESMDVLPQLSIVGGARKLTCAEYYFGHMDPYRVILYKDLGYTLQPPPKTPGAKKSEDWNVGCAERSSGVEHAVPGFDGVLAHPSNIAGTGGWYRSEKAAGSNFDIELEVLGPPTPQELAELKKQIAKYRPGVNFIDIAPVRGAFPLHTMGQEAAKQMERQDSSQ